MDTNAGSQVRSEAANTQAGTGFAGACDEPPPPLFLKGIREFNEGSYWECHETLEQLWRAEPRPVRDLYQGILQVGVGFHHLRNGNYAGAVKVLGRGLPRLQRLPDLCQGVRVAELADAAWRVYQAILALGPDRVGEFDLSTLPRIWVGTGYRSVG